MTNNTDGEFTNNKRGALRNQTERSEV